MAAADAGRVALALTPNLVRAMMVDFTQTLLPLAHSGACAQGGARGLAGAPGISHAAAAAADAAAPLRAQMCTPSATCRTWRAAQT
jgi:hypothetical protein